MLSMIRRTTRHARPKRVITGLWASAAPLGDNWFTSPECSLPTWQVAAIKALRPVHDVAYRARLGWLLLTTSRNSADVAAWERRDLRFKALALLLVPWSHGDYSKHRHYDPVLSFDIAVSDYSWSCTTIEAPVGWRRGGLRLYTDGDTKW